MSTSARWGKQGLRIALPHACFLSRLNWPVLDVCCPGSGFTGDLDRVT